jgi:hypothetical protein
LLPSSASLQNQDELLGVVTPPVTPPPAIFRRSGSGGVGCSGEAMVAAGLSPPILSSTLSIGNDNEHYGGDDNDDDDNNDDSSGKQHDNEEKPKGFEEEQIPGCSWCTSAAAASANSASANSSSTSSGTGGDSVGCDGSVGGNCVPIIQESGGDASDHQRQEQEMTAATATGLSELLLLSHHSFRAVLQEGFNVDIVLLAPATTTADEKELAEREDGELLSDLSSSSSSSRNSEGVGVSIEACTAVLSDNPSPHSDGDSAATTAAGSGRGDGGGGLELMIFARQDMDAFFMDTAVHQEDVKEEGEEKDPALDLPLPPSPLFTLNLNEVLFVLTGHHTPALKPFQAFTVDQALNRDEEGEGKDGGEEGGDQTDDPSDNVGNGSGDNDVDNGGDGGSSDDKGQHSQQEQKQQLLLPPSVCLSLVGADFSLDLAAECEQEKEALVRGFAALLGFRCSNQQEGPIIRLVGGR